MSYKGMAGNLLAAFIVTPNAYSAPPDVLPLPQGDVPERYYLQSRSELTVDHEYLDAPEITHNENRWLIDYQLVKEDEDDILLLMSPQYLNTTDDYKYDSEKTLDDGHSDDADLTAAEWVMTLDEQSGNATRLIYHQERNEDELYNHLEDHGSVNLQLLRPGFGAGISLTPGAQRRLPAEGLLPAITVKVVDLNSEYVLLQFQADENDSRLFGYSLVDRHSGWPVQGMMAADIAYEYRSSISVSYRTTAILQPPSNPDFIDISFFEDHEPRVVKTSPSVSISSLPADIDMLAEEEGELTPGQESIYLRYPLPDQDIFSAGSIELTEPEAFNREGQPLDMRLQPQATYITRRSQQVASSTELLPLGWHNPADAIDQLGSIEATLSWYGQTTHELRIPLPAGQDSVQVDGAGGYVTLTPDQVPDTYQLQLNFPKTDLILLQAMGGISSYSLDIPLDEAAPDWVTPAESRMFGTLQRDSVDNDRYTVTLTIEVEAGVETLTIPVSVRDREPKAQQRVTYYSAAVLQDDVSRAPEQSVPLFQQRAMALGHDDFLYDSDLATLAPEAYERPQLFLTLTPAQDELCELISPNTQVIGDAIEWQEYIPRASLLERHKMSPYKTYQLASVNNEVKYFYQKEVSIGLVCSGEPEWQTLDIALGEHDWLVDIEQLLGEDWQKQALSSKPLATFFSHYRFIDEHGDALTIEPPSSEAEALTIHRDTLLDFATHDGKLRIAGHVAHVEQMHASGEPLALEWQHTFPDVPHFNSELYPSAEDDQ